MASINDVFNALNDIKGKLDQLHADELDAQARIDTTNNKLDAIVEAINTVGTGITSRLDQLVTIETRTSEIVLHTTKQNEAILCALEHVSQNTCDLVTISDQQLGALNAVQISTRIFAELSRLVHADAALELDRHDSLQAQIDKCCPPEPHRPRCEYAPCKDPGPFRVDD